MLRKFAAALAVVLCLANANATRAEPGAVINWLMNEPASLFDIGMLLLSQEASEWGRFKFVKQFAAKYGGQTFFLVDYDWDENRIYVSGYITADIVGRTEQKAACKALIIFMSDLAGVDPTTGRALSGLNSSSWSQHFSHADYVKTTEPKDYQSRLDQIFVLRVFVGPPAKQGTKCRRQLLSSEVYFEE
jgi:hypothetical protein